MNQLPHAILLTLCAAAVLAAQEPPPPPEGQAPQTQPAGAVRPGVTPPSQEPQPYEKVITKDAKSKKCILIVHQIKEKYYYEIPKSEFNKVFLWNTSIARTTLGVGYGHQELTEHVVHWELKGNRVHLRENNYEVIADPKTPIAEAVDAANNSTIIMTFPVAAFAKDGAPVIEVTRLFSTDVPEISAPSGWAPHHGCLALFHRAHLHLPENIEAEAEVRSACERLEQRVPFGDRRSPDLLARLHHSPVGARHASPLPTS